MQRCTPSTGLSSGSLDEEREEGLYKPVGVMRRNPQRQLTWTLRAPELWTDN